MNEIAKQYEAAIRYGRDHEAVASIVADAQDRGFYGALHDYLIDSGHPLTPLAEAAATERPIPADFYRRLGSFATKTTIIGPYIREDQRHPTFTGPFGWTLDVAKVKQRDGSTAYYTEAKLPTRSRVESHPSLGDIDRSVRHSLKAVLSPDEMQRTLAAIVAEEKGDTGERQAMAYLRRHFKVPSPPV